VPRLPRRLVPRAVAAAVALVGALLIGLGALFATTLAPDREVTARLDGIGRQPVVTTQIGLLDLEGPRVRVQAVADGKPVFLGIGRAKDVEAYLDKVSRLEVVGHDAQGGLVTEQVTGEKSVPDPAGVDVWTVSTRTQNSASVVWPDTPGQWRLVAATDGESGGPTSVDVTWTAERRSSSAPALIAVGILLLVGGGVTLAMLVSRAGLDRQGPPSPPSAPPRTRPSPRREARQNAGYPAGRGVGEP
jgi:hypothetical protein